MASFGYPPSAGFHQLPMQKEMPASKVELHISCNGLQKMDITSHSDPMAVLHMYDKVTKKWTEVNFSYKKPSHYLSLGVCLPVKSCTIFLSVQS